MGRRVLAYDTRKPYKMVVSTQGTLLIQNGIVYQYGSGQVLGPVAVQLGAENKNILYCKHSGATFPNTPDGKIALQAYQHRKGYINKESDGSKPGKESTMEERKAEIAIRREKINRDKED